MHHVPVALHTPNPLYRIRPVLLTDKEALHTACLPGRSATEVYLLIQRAQQIGRQGRGLGVVAIAPGTHDIIGFGQFTVWPRVGEISDLVVAEAWRQRGVGTTIIQYLMRAAREMQVSVVEIGASAQNAGALRLYRRLGFLDDYTVDVDLGQGKERVLVLSLALE